MQFHYNHAIVESQMQLYHNSTIIDLEYKRVVAIQLLSLSRNCIMIVQSSILNSII